MKDQFNIAGFMPDVQVLRRLESEIKNRRNHNEKLTQANKKAKPDKNSRLQ